MAVLSRHKDQYFLSVFKSINERELDIFSQGVHSQENANKLSNLDVGVVCLIPLDSNMHFTKMMALSHETFYFEKQDGTTYVMDINTLELIPRDFGKVRNLIAIEKLVKLN